VAFGILIVPIIDTLRVFFYRISRGQSPFHADKTHVHHRLLYLGLSHLQVSLLLGFINVLFIILSFSFKDLGTLRLLLINFILGWLIFQIPSFMVGKKRKKLLKKRLLERSKQANNEG